MNDKFSFYLSFYEMLEELPQKQKLELLMAIIEYGLFGTEPKLTGALKACFVGIKPNIDNDNMRREILRANGSLGGNPNFQKNKPNPYYAKSNKKITKTLPTDNQEITKTLPTDNQEKTLVTIEREKEKEIDIEKDIDIDKEREKEKEKEEPTLESGQTSLSKAQKIFQNSFPNKKIDILPDESLIDINKLALAIKDSDFLSSSNNIGLKWCCEHYAEIVRGDYKNYKKPHNQKLNEAYAEQPFTADELASLAEVLEENKKLEK